MVAGSESGLQEIMDRLNVTAEQYRMKINIKKTKVMKCLGLLEERSLL